MAVDASRPAVAGRSRRSRPLAVLVLATALATPAGIGAVESKPAGAAPGLTWVRTYSAPAGEGAGLTAHLAATVLPRLEELRAGGRIADWGLAAPATRRAGGPTHLLYLTLDGWSTAEEPLAALALAEGPGAPAALAAALAGAEDLVLRRLVVSAPAAGTPRYLLLATHLLRAGRDGEMERLWTEGEPALARLAHDGALLEYALAAQELVSQPEWSHLVWILLPELSALAELRRALDEQEAARSAEARSERAARVADALVPEAHRAQLFRLVAGPGTPPSAPP